MLVGCCFHHIHRHFSCIVTGHGPQFQILISCRCPCYGQLGFYNHAKITLTWALHPKTSLTALPSEVHVHLLMVHWQCGSNKRPSHQVKDKENLSRWWGEDRENPRDEPLSLDQAFPTLTSSTWLIIYLAYFLPKSNFNQMLFGLQSIWPIYRIGKCVHRHSRTSNG